jgi:zinc transport system substrate-binding protein
METLLLSRLQGPRIVDTTVGLARRELADHDHDHDHDHGDHGLDPHVWLDPTLAAAQVRTIAAALSEVDPTGADFYAANADTFTASLAALDRELRQLLQPVAGRTLYVFHPSFGYFAAAYGLEQVAIEQGGLDPSPRHLARVLTDVRKSGARAVFVQPQFSVGAANAVAEASGVALVELDPLDHEYAANLRVMAASILAALR